MYRLARFVEVQFGIFFVLLIAFVPFVFDAQGAITKFLFQGLIAFFQQHFFKYAIKNIDFSSDTIGLNILLFILLVIAAGITFTLFLLKRHTAKTVYYAKILISYFLAFVLLKYGFDKLFKTQFYLPEPNILYTNFGNLSKDILFWSTIGTSRFYNLATGCIEILIAALLLIQYTRILGLLLAILSFTHILIINLGFDISVKTFSTLLIMMALYVVLPNLKQIWELLTKNQLANIRPVSTGFLTNPQPALIIKSIVIILSFVAIIFPYQQTNNYNDDTQRRHFLHGAYQVTDMVADNDTLNPADFPYKRIFFHRKNYLIFQKQNEEMDDYYVKIDSNTKEIELYDYHEKVTIMSYHYLQNEGILTLSLKTKKKNTITLKALNWKKLPALRNEFHLTIDEVQ